MRHGKTLRYYHRNYSTPVTPDETSNALNVNSALQETIIIRTTRVEYNYYIYISDIIYSIYICHYPSFSPCYCPHAWKRSDSKPHARNIQRWPLRYVSGLHRKSIEISAGRRSERLDRKSRKFKGRLTNLSPSAIAAGDLGPTTKAEIAEH